MTTRKQPRGRTTLSGLGHRHRTQRERLLQALPDGSACPLCSEPMWKRTQKLHADHSVPRAIAGPHGLADRIVHQSCNTREGGRLRAALAGQQVSEHSEPNRTGLAFAWP